jgi:hypothetical protein
MGYGVDFKGSNGVFRGNAENVNDIHTFRNRMCVVTCWELSDEELAEIVRTKRVFSLQFFGGQLVPHFIGASEPVREMAADYGGTFAKQD